MSRTLSARDVGLALGAVAAALILGALGFQYLGGLPPCEMCHWQRWPLFAAIATGLIGAGFGPVSARAPLAWLTLALVAVSGGIGAYQAGVEWHWWTGPQACTGVLAIASGPLDLNAPVPRCDQAAIRILGISLAGYNALICLGFAGVAAWLLARKR